ncbi:MAG: hypothetical protein C4335_08230 [Armatimonadota bacterium]
MRTLEDWFKYLEQQYVDEKAEKEKQEQTQPPAPKEANIPSAPSAPKTSVQPPRSTSSPPALEQVQMIETPVPDPAEYIFTLRRASSEPTPSSAEAEIEPQPRAQSASSAAPSAPGAEMGSAESVSEPSAEETPIVEPEPKTERPVRAKATRRAPYTRSVRPVPPPQSIEELWKRVPKHVRLLVELGDDAVTQRYYDRRFKESRQELVERLLNPSLTLEDTARLLGVCPTTVRRYTERGLLNHYRTPGNQRRFRLSDVIAFLEARQQAQEARRRKR